MLSQIVGHCIPYIPCQAHRLNTFIQHSCNSSLIVAELFNTLEALYVFFSSSTKRNKYLENMLSDIEGSLKLRNLSKFRWNACAESIKAVWTSFEETLQVLIDISLDKNTLDNKKYINSCF